MCGKALQLGFFVLTTRTQPPSPRHGTGIGQSWDVRSLGTMVQRRAPAVPWPRNIGLSPIASPWSNQARCASVRNRVRTRIERGEEERELRMTENHGVAGCVAGQERTTASVLSLIHLSITHTARGPPVVQLSPASQATLAATGAIFRRLRGAVPDETTQAGRGGGGGTHR